MPSLPIDSDREQAETVIEEITGSPIAQLTFNSAITRTTATEIQCVVSFGQRPLALFIVSPTMAKTLAEALMARVRDYEDLVGQPVLSLAEIANVIPKPLP